MKKFFLLLVVSYVLTACNQQEKPAVKEDNKELAALFDKYFDERM